MSEWRPGGFENPYTPDLEQTEEYLDHGARDQSIFEDGADAMLAALRENPMYKLNELPATVIRPYSSGTLVFIPDAPVEEKVA